MIIQHNIMALNAHRQLGGNNSTVQKNLEKLSSGFRINRAGDDAAGLAISEKMRAQITGLTRAQSNAQDGISLVQTAEGALTEVHSMLNRMVDLSTQSANGTLKDDDRTKIQDEMNALSEEIDRISQSTNFNGINLLDGSLAGGASGSGALKGGVASSFKAATTGATAGADMSAFAAFGTKETINVDGVDIEVDWSKLSADDQAAMKKDWAAGATTNDAKKAAEIMQNTINEAIDTANKTRNLNVNHIEVKGTQTGGAASFTVTSGLSGSKDSGIKINTGAGVMGTMLTGGTGAITGTAAGAGSAVYDTKATVDGSEVTLSNFAFDASNTTSLTAAEAQAFNDLIDALESGTGGIKATIAADGKATFSLAGYTLELAGGGAAEVAAGGNGSIAIKDAGGTTLATFTATMAGTAGNTGGATAGGDLNITGLTDAVAEVAAVPAGAITSTAIDRFSGDIKDVNGVNFDMELGGEKINISVTGIDNADNKGGDNATAIKTAINSALDNYIAAKGLSAEEGTALKDNLSVEFTKDGRFSITNNTGMSLSFTDKDGGKAAETLGIGGANGKVISGGLTLQIGDTGDDFNKVTVSVEDMSAAGLGIEGIKVTKQGVSDAAIADIKSAINKVSTNRSAMGALQNRLEHTINNLGVATENMTAAESRIRDVDMAKEMMHFTKNNVLSQAAQAMLAQANQQPQQVLQLLR